MKKLIAGNWKMNGTLGAAGGLVQAIAAGVLGDSALSARCDILVCPPFVHLAAARGALAGNLLLGAQDCSAYPGGAYTGDISAGMLKDCGCSHVILGHSERRHYRGENNTMVARKVTQAHAAGLVAIICVGESALEREQGSAADVVARQLEASLPPSCDAQNTVIAYEPVWAIGTGKTATPADAGSMHTLIREQLRQKIKGSEVIRILYGGSMKPDNAAQLLATAHVDGGLIGGASLNPNDFLSIARAAL